MSRKILLLWLLSIALSGCLGKGHMPKPQGEFNGEVIDSLTGEPVMGAEVSIAGITPVKTDNKGLFSIAVLPPGEYEFLMKRGWYQDGVFHVKHVGKKDVVQFKLICNAQLQGKILYSGDRDGKREIYELNLKNRSAIRLTYLSNSAEANPVRLDSDRIIFQSDMISGDYHKNDLFIFNVNSQQSEKICSVDNIDDQHPSLDDESKSKLVFKSMRDEEGQIFLYQLGSGKEPELIIKVKGEYPVIDPKGSKIAYVNTSDKLCIFDLLQPQNEGTNPRVINHLNKVSNPCWSPDGTRIAMDSWSDSSTEGRYIYIIEPDTSVLHQITYSYSSEDNHRHPCWSSDGKYIFFTGTIIYSSRTDIYCVRLNSDGLTSADNGQWLMVSSGSGSKDYPTWSGDE